MSTKSTEAEGNLPHTAPHAGQADSAGWLERHITLHTHDSVKEEKASGIVHAVGAGASAAALVLLTIKGIESGSFAIAASYMVYSLSMLILYLSSSLYHFAPVSKKKRILRICDHMSIYLLIAGTYTPVSVALGGYWGTLTLVLIWSFAAAGMAFKIVFWGRFRFVQVAVYILMGWMVVLVGKPVLEAFPREFIYTALAGGITYTSGTIIYAMKKLPYYHALWHLFVLTGSVLFFFAIYLYI